MNRGAYFNVNNQSQQRMAMANSATQAVRAHQERLANAIGSIDQRFVPSTDSKWLRFDMRQACYGELQQVLKPLVSNDRDAQFAQTVEQLLISATMFASTPLNERLQEVPALVRSIVDLIEQIRQEVQELEGMANEFDQIIHSFIKLVHETKHKMKLFLPHLETAGAHLEVLMKSLDDNEEAFTKAMKDEALAMAIDGLHEETKKLDILSQNSLKESEAIGNNLERLESEATAKKSALQQRIDLAYYLPQFVLRIEPSVSSNLISGKVLDTVTEYAVKSPIMTLIFTHCIVFISAGFSPYVLINLVCLLYLRHKNKTLEFLTILLNKIVEVKQINITFSGCLEETRVTSNQMEAKLPLLKNAMTNELYLRHQGKHTATKVHESLTTMISSMQQIIDLDISQLIENSSSVPELSNPAAAQSTKMNSFFLPPPSRDLDN